MRLLITLLLSLVLHLLVGRWWHMPVVADEPELTGGAGRAALAIQSLRIVRPTAAVTPPPEVVASPQVQQPAPPSQLLAAAKELKQAVAEKEPAVKESPQEWVEPPPPEVAVESEKPGPEEVAPESSPPDQPREDPMLEQVDRAEQVAVVSTSEVKSNHAGFDQLPTMEQPRYRKAHPPIYPRLARRWGQQGVVIVRAQVGVDGCVEEVELLASSGYTALDNSALETVSEWEFYPHREGGVLTTSWVEVPVEFTLQ